MHKSLFGSFNKLEIQAGSLFRVGQSSKFSDFSLHAGFKVFNGREKKLCLIFTFTPFRSVLLQAVQLGIHFQKALTSHMLGWCISLMTLINCLKLTKNSRNRENKTKKSNETRIHYILILRIVICWKGL